jgi:hypothetical protein
MSIIAMLGLGNEDSKHNIECRRHLFYATIAVNVCVASPFFVLVTWGITAISTVKPPAVGFFLVFVGSGTLVGIYGVSKWIQTGWRMTKDVLFCFATACVAGFLFLFCSIFADPQVFLGGAQVDYFSLTSFFLTLNMMPMIWLTFTNDNKLMKSLAQVLAVVTVNKKVGLLKKKFKTLGTVGIKLATATDALRHERGMKPVSPFDAFLGSHYSIVRTIPGFHMADILQNAFVTSPESQKRANQRCYALAVAILVIYTLVAYFRSAYPYQGIGILFTILIIDSTLWLVNRGHISWSAGYISLIIGLCRISLVVTAGPYWLLGQTLAFVIFGVALCREIVGRNLPRISAAEAGGITFFGHHVHQEPLLDISATPEFAMGFLSFFFLFLLVGYAFTSDASSSASIAILGQNWPLWVFGVLAFVVALFYGIALGSSRAFFLMKQKLLSEYATHIHLFHPSMRLPFMLAAASELMVVCCGLFLFAATKSSFIMLLAVFSPLLLMLSTVVLVQWRKNDYRLVIWPPEDEEDELEGDDFDEEAEFAKEADAMRSAFVLPPLRGTTDTNEFKMPPLPVLRGGAFMRQVEPKMAEKDEDDEEAPKDKSKEEEADAEDAMEEAAKEAESAERAVLETETPLMKTENANTSTLSTMLPNLNPTPAVESVITVALTPGKKQQTKWSHRWPQFSVTATSILPRLKRAWQQRKEKPKVDGGSPPEVDFDHMTLRQAYREGYLLPEDYLTLRCFALLLASIFLFGLLASFTEVPMWYGHLLWLSTYVAIFSIAPVVKWYNVLEITVDMKACLGFATAIAWSTGLGIFIFVLDVNVNDVHSLWILMILLYYPLTLLFLVALAKWHDDHYVLSDFVRKTALVSLAGSIPFAFVLFIWVSVPVGGAFSFAWGTGCVIIYFMMQWVRNDYYLAPYYQRRANRLIWICALLFVVLAVFFRVNIFFCFSISVIVLLLKLSMNIVAIKLCREPDLQIFYSPYIFPIYSYNATTNNVNNENAETLNIYLVLLVGYFWGCVGVLFFDPLGFGIGLSSLVLLSFVGVTAHLCSITPVRMGIASKYVNEEILHEAGAVAKDVFQSRRQPLALESVEFIERARREKEAELEYQRLSYGKTKKDAAVPSSVQEKSTSAAGMERTSAADVAISINDTLWQCSNWTGKKGGQWRRRDALLTTHDILVEILQEGLGPFGFVSFFGYGYKAWVYIRAHPKVIQLLDILAAKHRRYLVSVAQENATSAATQLLEEGDGPAATNGHHKDSSSRTTCDAQAKIDIVQENDDNDRPFDAEAAKPPPKRQSLFKFLGHTRASQTAAAKKMTVVDDENEDPPSNLVDVLELLQSLPAKDIALDVEFFEETRCMIHFQLLVLNAADARLSRERVLFQKFLRENRFKLMSNGINPPADIFKTSSYASIDVPLVATWLISLTKEERQRFHALKTAFSHDMDRKDAITDAEDAASRAHQNEVRAYWQAREIDMCRKMYEESVARRLRREQENIAVDPKIPEATLNAQEALAEIESGYACIVGQYGRSLQFVDPEFPPDHSSLAGCVNEADIVDWRVSTAINITSGLFAGGTDPDDVRFGRLNNGWFLSAVSILAASGGLDDGKVDPIIENLFITKQTSLTGAYAVRFFKNSQWETVIVDDYFPVLDDSHKMDDSAGAAFGHSLHFEELWVPILEKAYAKYHGGYAALEQGYVHHALHDLTGYETEEVFLSQASRGARKKTLWKQLLQHKRNHFLMGAGTITSDSADHEILDTGLVFGACYVIYDVREIDGYQLLKLRNPPGDHAEWRGDWGDTSPLWTRRLKKHLGVCADANDNTFWMSFDDFCNAFRCLYVCKYYDPMKWPIVTFHGEWSVQADTAAGLPTVHNPECHLEANPHYSIVVTRPTEIIVTVTQVDKSGLAPVTVLPFSVYVVQGAMQDRSTRVKSLEREHVVLHSGAPVRERQLTINGTLSARTYTLVIVAYKKGMEGPFKVMVQSNYAVHVEQIWPAIWRDVKLNSVEKLAMKVRKSVADSSAVAKLAESANKYKNKIAVGVEEALKDDLDEIKMMNDAKEAEEKAKKKSPWIEQWDDVQNKPYYFNKQTGISQWDIPPDM